MKNFTFIFFTAFLSFAFQLQAQETTESEKLNEWFDKVFDEGVDRSPVWQAYLGIKKNITEWDDNSEARALEDLNITKNNLEYLKNHFNYETLDATAKLSYDLFVLKSENEINNFQYRHHNYPVNQMRGTHSWIPSFLIDIHRMDNESDALAYITRVQKVPQVIEQLIDNLKIREAKNIIAPRFVFPKVQDDCKNLLKGKPFQKSDKPSTLLEDFTKKVNALDLPDNKKKELLKQLEKALKENFKPAYEKLMAYLKEMEKKATNDAGVWKFPDGNNFFNARLASITTTNMSGEEIFETGMKEIERIHQEMRDIMMQTGFESENLKDFFKFMEESSQFYYEQSEAGRAQCLADNLKIIDEMRERLPEFFNVFPKAELKVKPVEAYREKSAGKAFYQRPAPDGSRPGIYYINLYDMKQMPKYQLEALAYHEGIPGHHMQISINQELEGLPKFRTLGGGYTAYVEGWGLYSEYFPKEFGFYRDPYSDFGRLAMELWRACRLVVDVGIHEKKWTREQAIQFYKDNTPDSEDDCVKMVERHIVMPGQATAYKIGQMKILALREMAQQTLKEKFDLRAFHDVVLKNGALPLDALEKVVREWLME